MNPFIQIFYYIFKNNPWYLVPLRLWQAMLYQCSKRVTQKIVSKKLFNGKKILLFPQNPISSAFIYCAVPDQLEISLLRQLADKNTVFLDVGANIGAYSLLLLDKVKEVFAFEAHPLSANYCKMNFLLNEVKESQVITAAVSANNEQKFFSNLGEGSPINKMVEKTKGAICVPAITLDDFIASQGFDRQTHFLLKVDVEGFEKDVFLGAQQFLTHFCVKAIVFEALGKNQEAITLLRTLGYQVKPLAGNNMLAVPSGSK